MNAVVAEPDTDRPVAGYAVLMSAFAALSGGFGLWLRSSGRDLPERIAPGDLALGAVATQKAARLIAKDRVTSGLRAPFTEYQEEGGPGEVEEAARGTGVRRAIGELLVCPYCLGVWLSAAFVAGLVVAPRATRAVASTFAVLSGSDMLQVAYVRAERTLG
jgi:hypothetical protein